MIRGEILCFPAAARPAPVSFRPWHLRSPVIDMASLLTSPDFLLVSFTLGLILSLSVLVARMPRRQLIHKMFQNLLLCLLIYAIGWFLLLANHLLGNPIQIWMVNLAYIGLILIPMAVLYTGIVYSRSTLKLASYHWLSFLVPAVSIILLLTNSRHHLFYRFYQYDLLTDASALGPYFIFHSLYSYACISVGMIFLLLFSIKNAGIFSRQSLLIFGGIVLSSGFNILVTAQVFDASFHSTVIVLAFSCLLFYLAIFKYDFLNVVPIALQMVVDHISDCFLVFDPSERLIDYNQPFVDLFGAEFAIERKLTLDQIIERVSSNPSLHQLLCAYSQISGQQQRISVEQSLEISGKIHHFSIEATPLVSQSRFMGTIILLKDITQVREALESLQQNREILMEKERLASLGQLIGGIAHNLKTPIMSIAGGIEAIKDLTSEYEESIGDLTVTAEDHREIAREIKNWLGKIQPHCAYMSDIITTVKGQAAQFNTNEVMLFSLDELIHRVNLLMKHELKRYRCQLRINYLTDGPFFLKGEINSLVQIFDNLIINALQSYQGKQGVVDLTIRQRNDREQAIFELRDYGSGIPEPVQERLFREMVTTKGKQGTGLGLYMSHATVRGKFGGRMWFESKPGEGTAFFLSLPCSPIPGLDSQTEFANNQPSGSSVPVPIGAERP